MARVSRALSGVALDVLWGCIDDIFHLIDVVPSCYTYVLDEEGHFREGVIFTRIPDERELFSLSIYAAKIRELRLPRDGFQYEGVTELLHWFPPDVPILPQLHRLNWDFGGDYCKMPPSGATRLLNSGNLRHFSLLLDGLDHYRANILNDIHPILWELHSLRFHFSVDNLEWSPPREFIIDDKSLVWHLPHLKSLEVDDKFTLTRPILVSLSELSLQSLTLGHFSTSITAQTLRLHFPALLSLSLNARVSDIVDIMQSISFPSATGICLNCDGGGSISEHRTSFRAIYSAFPMSLRRLHIEFRVDTVEQEEAALLGPGVLNFDAFVRPIQSLRNLRELKLDIRLREHIDGFLELRNGDLRSLVPAWPELSFFEYSIRSRHLPMPSQGRDGTTLGRDDPTLDTVFAFARAHPHLLHLQLPYVRTDPLPEDPPPLEEAARPLEGHGLLWLKVGRPPGRRKDSAYLAPIVQAVDRAFPRLYEEVQRERTSSKFLRWSFLEKELCSLHGEEYKDDEATPLVFCTSVDSHVE